MEYVIKIDDGAVKLISAGLGKLPLEQVGNFWDAFRNEIQRQQMAAQNADAAEKRDAPVASAPTFPVGHEKGDQEEAAAASQDSES